MKLSVAASLILLLMTGGLCPAASAKADDGLGHSLLVDESEAIPHHGPEPKSEFVGNPSGPHHVLVRRVSATDCYALYSSGNDYKAGDVVAADVIQQETVDKQCSPGSSGCSCDVDDAAGPGCKKSVIQDIQVRYNFECTSGPNSVFCNNDGYAPGGLYSGQAWIMGGTACTKTATPATVAPPAEWSEGGCPAPYKLGTAYAPSAAVSVATSDGHFLVYQCTSDKASSAWCGMEGYQPGESVHYVQVWILRGSCGGTLSPSSIMATDVGEGYLGGCPGEWEARDVADPYSEGDRISKDGIIYECSARPNNLHCGQAGYEPLAEGNGNPTAWQTAWTIKGTCSGTIAPTSSPSFDPENSVGACPDEWEAGNDHTKYQPGDMVSVTVSTTPLRQVAYKCKDDVHLAGNCALYAPTAVGGDLGWDYAGSCDGSMGPTSSPTFDDLKPLIDGCPPQWVANTNYEADDQVTVVVSEAPERKIVYECKKYPYTGYCLQFAPGSKYGSLGWQLKSACEGTMAPTPAPQPYVNVESQAGEEDWPCQYEKCREEEVDKPCTYNPASCPASGCASCRSYYTGSYWTSTCTGCTEKVAKMVCRPAPVDNWGATPLTEYSAGDVVRVGIARFKAKGYPNYLWARQEAYKPNDDANGIWTKAWTRDGDCGHIPNSSPTILSPTNPSPTNPSPTIACPNQYFVDKDELLTAITNYVSQNCTTNTTCAVGQEYGHPIGTWCVGDVTDMSELFSGSWSDPNTFMEDIGDWDVSSVTNMEAMFYYASEFNSDISGWDVSSVTNMHYMFYKASQFDQPLLSWDVSSATDMSYMFRSASEFNTDISGWDVSSVTDMDGMFRDASVFNTNISGWDVSSVTDMDGMFSGASAFNTDISGWDVSSVATMWSMFSGASAFNADISGWDVSSVTSMRNMFSDASTFNQPLSSWDVSRVTTMHGMFSDASQFNTDISGWDVSSVKGMGNMFQFASKFNTDISGWDVSSVVYMSWMFYEATYFNQPLLSWNVSGVTDMEAMFDSSEFNADISDWDVSSVENMRYMFKEAPYFNQPLSSWNVSSVTDMEGMFYSASKFNQDLCSWGQYYNETIVYKEWYPGYGYNVPAVVYNGMFASSGCPDKQDPLDSTTNWCKATCP